MNAFSFLRAPRRAVERVKILEASIPEAKRLLARCQAQGIDAELGGKDCCGGGCSPKAALLVAEADIPRVQALLQDEFQSLVERESHCDKALLERVRAAAESAAANPEAGPFCPACGHQGPLERGACGDCGLMFG